MINGIQKVLKEVPTLKDLRRDYPEVKTVLFDMDGTLFDTEKYHAEALLKMAVELKIKPPHSAQEVYEMMVGKADHLLFEIIKNWQGFPASWTAEHFIENKNQSILKIVNSKSQDEYFHQELRDLIIEIQTEKIHLGLVTSSEKVITMELLKKANLEQHFNFVLTRDDSIKVKPDPWPYLHTMNVFKSTPEETIIFEDSKIGLEAAKSSGAHAIKVEWY